MPPTSEDGAVAALGDYCAFGEDRVYLLAAIARRKENPRTDAGATFREVVGDGAALPESYRRLRCSARAHRSSGGDPLAFRLYVTVNARNAPAAYFAFRRRTGGWVEDRINGDEGAPPKFKRVDGYWRAELQKPAVRDESRFLFDLDEASEAAPGRLRSALEEVADVVTWRATPNGYHVVTEPFDYTDFDVGVDYELKTDGLLFVDYLGGGGADGSA